MTPSRLRLVSGVPLVREKLTRLYAARVSGDLAAFAGGFKADGVFHLVGDARLVTEAGRHRGRTAIETVLRNLQAAPEAVRTGIRNNLGGHWNHVHFWEVMTPGGAKEPGTELATAINGAFTDFSQFRQRLNAAAGGRFGSGWAWLVVDKDRKLAIVSTANQDNPLMDGAKGVVLGVDVWEHAYYLKYQNRRADYVTAWWNTVNWTKAAANYQKAMT